MKQIRNLFSRLIGEPEPPTTQFEAMTGPKVDYSFRIYWTKMTRNWSAEQRSAARASVAPITQQASFDANLIEKRYEVPLDGIPENTHSGRSLLALITVLDALDSLEKEA